MESECERLGRHVCGHERLYTTAEVAEILLEVVPDHSPACKALHFDGASLGGVPWCSRCHMLGKAAAKHDDIAAELRGKERAT